jgi:hypothetical protein
MASWPVATAATRNKYVIEKTVVFFTALSPQVSVPCWSSCEPFINIGFYDKVIIEFKVFNAAFSKPSCSVGRLQFSYFAIG